MYLPMLWRRFLTSRTIACKIGEQIKMQKRKITRVKRPKMKIIFHLCYTERPEREKLKNIEKIVKTD